MQGIVLLSSRAFGSEMEAILLSPHFLSKEGDLTDFVHCCVGKSRNIDIFASPFLLALNEIASNLSSRYAGVGDPNLTVSRFRLGGTRKSGHEASMKNAARRERT